VKRRATKREVQGVNNRSENFEHPVVGNQKLFSEQREALFINRFFAARFRRSLSARFQYSSLRSLSVASLLVSRSHKMQLGVNVAGEVVSLGESKNKTDNKKKRGGRKFKGTQAPIFPIENKIEDDKPAVTTTQPPPPNLKQTPQEWHATLSAPPPDSVLLDTRNNYESSIGYFKNDSIPTVLTNTRQFSSIQKTYEELFKEGELEGKHVYMYCTGGVRCESASRALIESGTKWGGGNVKSVTSLDGGICKYLDEFGATKNDENTSLYKGKNFVFDPRRFDPNVGDGCVGECIVCNNLHDDYDNGKGYWEDGEVRCVDCRVLVLLCRGCVEKGLRKEVKCGKGGTSCGVQLKKQGAKEWEVLN